jgi:hypothetical protein
MPCEAIVEALVLGARWVAPAAVFRCADADRGAAASWPKKPLFGSFPPIGRAHRATILRTTTRGIDVLLQNKVAVITGIGPGMGRETALLFARNGASLAIGARTEAMLESVAREV